VIAAVIVRLVAVAALLRAKLPAELLQRRKYGIVGLQRLVDGAQHLRGRRARLQVEVGCEVRGHAGGLVELESSASAHRMRTRRRCWKMKNAGQKLSTKQGETRKERDTPEMYMK